MAPRGPPGLALPSWSLPTTHEKATFSYHHSPVPASLTPLLSVAPSSSAQWGQQDLLLQGTIKCLGTHNHKLWWQTGSPSLASRAGFGTPLDPYTEGRLWKGQLYFSQECIFYMHNNINSDTKWPAQHGHWTWGGGALGVLCCNNSAFISITQSAHVV